jgi:hypothetical protein
MAELTDNGRPLKALKAGDVIYFIPGYGVEEFLEDIKGGKRVDTAAIVVCRGGRLGYVWLNDEEPREEKYRSQGSCLDNIHYLDDPENKVEWYPSQSAAIRAFLRQERDWAEENLQDVQQAEAAAEEYFGKCREECP